MRTELKAGDVIPAGSVVLITDGIYSGYGVTGVFMATTDTVVPGHQGKYDKPDVLSPDNKLLSTLLEEVQYLESWEE